MNKKVLLAVLFLILSIILVVIIAGRWTLTQAPQLAAHAVESAEIETLSAAKEKVSNADLTPPPANTPADVPVITPTNEIPLTPQPVQGRYGRDYLSADELETLARLVFLEARGESFSGQQAVAEVVLNRVLSPFYPDNVYDVIYDPGQFSPAGQIPYTTPTQTQYDAVAAALSGPNIIPQQVLYFACGQNGRSNVWGWIGNHCFCY